MFLASELSFELVPTTNQEILEIDAILNNL